MHKYAEVFARRCKESFDLSTEIEYNYKSLSVCILDCVYSLRARYEEVTVPIVDRYAKKCMGRDRHAAGDTVSDLLERMDDMGNRKFAEQVLKNNQKLGGKKQIPKEEICYQLARYLRDLGIETIKDFRAYPSQEILEIVIRAVDGLGDAGTNYLFMLAGDKDRCKPDVHIHNCIRDFCGSDISNEECQILFTDAVTLLRETYPKLTVRSLDGIIWRVYRNKSRS